MKKKGKHPKEETCTKKQYCHIGDIDHAYDRDAHLSQETHPRFEFHGPENVRWKHRSHRKENEEDNSTTLLLFPKVRFVIQAQRLKCISPHLLAMAAKWSAEIKKHDHQCRGLMQHMKLHRAKVTREQWLEIRTLNVSGIPTCQ